MLDTMEVKAQLREMSDQKYREFHSKLLPGVENILGVRVPNLWKLARRLVREEGEKALSLLTDETYEEIMLQGMILCFLKEEPARIFERLPAYMEKIDNWAECDIICSGLKMIKDYQPEALLFLTPYLYSQKEFMARFSVVLLLDYFVTEEYIGQVLSLLDSVKHPGYYVKMAVAWAVSACFVEFPKKTLAYLRDNTLDDMTYNKALQKITESYRVDKEMKSLIRSMKRPRSGRDE